VGARNGAGWLSQIGCVLCRLLDIYIYIYIYNVIEWVNAAGTIVRNPSKITNYELKVLERLDLLLSLSSYLYLYIDLSI